MRLKKKVKRFLIISGSLITLNGIFYTTDYIRVKNQTKPIFCIPVNEQDSLGLWYKVSKVNNELKIGSWFKKYDVSYQEEEKQEEVKEDKKENDFSYQNLEDIELEYTLGQMIEDKCYIIMSSNTVYHLEMLDNFIKNVENKANAEVRIVKYTTEGQAIITNVQYKDNKFIVSVDNRRDSYNTNTDKIIVKEYDGSKYKLVKSDKPRVSNSLKKVYSVDLKNIDTEEVISLTSYVEVKREDSFKLEVIYSANEGKKVILESNSYNLYSYNSKINVVINNEVMSLKDALTNKKISIDDILNKINKDYKDDKVIYGNISNNKELYLYNDYAIIRNNKSIYLGMPSMDFKDID